MSGFRYSSVDVLRSCRRRGLGGEGTKPIRGRPGVLPGRRRHVAVYSFTESLRNFPLKTSSGRCGSHIHAGRLLPPSLPPSIMLPSFPSFSSPPPALMSSLPPSSLLEVVKRNPASVVNNELAAISFRPLRLVSAKGVLPWTSQIQALNTRMVTTLVVVEDGPKCGFIINSLNDLHVGCIFFTVPVLLRSSSCRLSVVNARGLQTTMRQVIKSLHQAFDVQQALQQGEEQRELLLQQQRRRSQAVQVPTAVLPYGGSPRFLRSSLSWVGHVYLSLSPHVFPWAKPGPYIMGVTRAKPRCCCGADDGTSPSSCRHGLG